MKNLPLEFRLHEEGIEAFLDQCEMRRLRTESPHTSFCGHGPPSPYPGLYAAEDVDDGRLDHEARRPHFVRADNVIDEREPYPLDEEDEAILLGDAQRGSRLPSWEGTELPARERGYPMPSTVLGFHRRKPPLENVLVRRPDGRFVPYTPIARRN